MKNRFFFRAREEGFIRKLGNFENVDFPGFGEVGLGSTKMTRGAPCEFKDEEEM